MNILYLSELGHPALLRRLTAMASLGHDVQVIPLIQPDRASIVQCKAIKVHRPILNLEDKSEGRCSLITRETIVSLSERINYIKPDILQAHYLHGCGTIGALCNYHPFVLSIAGPNELNCLCELPRRERFLALHAIDCADAVITVSEDLTAMVIKINGESKNVYTVCVGVDTSKFRYRQDVRALRDSLNIGDSPVVLSTRTFMPIYNIDEIIKAIPFILTTRPDIKFVFATLNIFDNAYYRTIEALVKKLKIGYAVRLVGAIPYKKMPLYYSLATFLVSVPSFDGTASSLLEAMACGCIPVVSDLPSARKWVRNGMNGIVITKVSAMSICEAIVKTLRKGSNEVMRMINFNKKLVAEKAEFIDCAKKVEKIYDNLIQRKNGS